jgi:glycosyltransferase involved in cell wall biosynthesis
MPIPNTALTLKDLPPSPAGKTGWPWTEQSPLLPERMPDGSEWPRISIVTPSYNQGQFIEETIRSILLQGYPNLDYIIIDGGSTDKSVEIIQKYARWLSYWSSEKDGGQSEAINKGFARSTGQIMGWVNSDDLLVSSALYILACVYKPGLSWWHGDALHMLQNGSLKNYPQFIFKINQNYLLHSRLIIQQISTFWSRDLWEKSGSYISLLDMAMDYELWLRFSKYCSASLINETLGIFRTHEEAKTGTDKGFSLYVNEVDSIRINEYDKRRYGRILRFIFVSFWTRLYLSKVYGWRSWFGRRQIPYI